MMHFLFLPFDWILFECCFFFTQYTHVAVESSWIAHISNSQISHVHLAKFTNQLPLSQDKSGKQQVQAAPENHRRRGRGKYSNQLRT